MGKAKNKTPVEHAGEIVAQLTELMAAADTNAKAVAAVGSKRQALLAGGSVRVHGGGGSNSPEFDGHLRDEASLKARGEQAAKALRAAVIKACPFIVELFGPVLETNLEAATEAALVFCPNEPAARQHAEQALEVWTLRELLLAAGNVASFSPANRARLFIKHLNLFLEAEAAKVSTETAQA